ncbi:MAG: hypothetical protein KDI19_15735 [Pseudomonadales bacterium]|nr:hypothetical protein [Pseudomonadales bacterium]
MDTATLLWGMLFGSIGVGFWMYGKKQKRTVPFIVGLVLMVFPYFIQGTFPTVLTGVVLCVIPAFVKI